MTTAAAPGSSAAILSVEGLSVDGPSGPIVTDVDFDVPRGTTVALVGQSGVGKSLLSLALLGLLPDGVGAHGSAHFRARGAATIDLLGLDERASRSFRLHSVGVVFQEPASAFDPLQRIGRQIGEVLGARTGIRGAARTAAVIDLLNQVRLDRPARIAGSYPHEVSGGQLQRAMIAMALSHDPELLIADEPTTALDTRVQAEILSLLRTLQAERGLTILVITHDMGVVADIAHSVVVLSERDDGPAAGVVEQGSVEDVLLRPTHPRTSQLLDAVARLDGAGVAPPVEPGDPVAVLTDATVRYGRGASALTAVDGVSLQIRAGETVALVGESGAGKSTLGRVLVGLETLTSGAAVVAGVDLGGRRARRALAPHIGIVFQDPGSSLNPQRRVGDSLELPLRLHTDLDAAARTIRVTELLAEVGLGAGYARRYPRELSGGQRQRVALARALATEPAVLVADEPTSALDATTQRAVLELLTTLRARHQFAAVLITHDLAVAEAVADRVVVLRSGVVVEEGPTKQVLADPQSDYAGELVAATPIADPIAQRARRRQGGGPSAGRDNAR